MAKKKTAPKLVTNALVNPVTQATQQIMAALQTSSTVPALLRNEATRLNEMADLIQAALDDKPAEPDGDEEDEEETSEPETPKE